MPFTAAKPSGQQDMGQQSKIWGKQTPTKVRTPVLDQKYLNFVANPLRDEVTRTMKCFPARLCWQATTCNLHALAKLDVVLHRCSALDMQAVLKHQKCKHVFSCNEAGRGHVHHYSINYSINTATSTRLHQHGRGHVHNYSINTAICPPAQTHASSRAATCSSKCFGAHAQGSRDISKFAPGVIPAS